MFREMGMDYWLTRTQEVLESVQSLAYNTYGIWPVEQKSIDNAMKLTYGQCQSYLCKTEGIEKAQ